MDFVELLRDAWGYTDAGILKNTNRWMKLILAVICLGIPFNGYVLRVYRGADPAPDVDEWGTLFVDGLKMLAISVVYILPLMLLMFILIGAMMVATVIGGEALGVFAGILGALANVLFYVLEFIVMALLPVAFIRFARTGVFAEAFNFAAMRETIGKIGWITYIVAVVLIALIIGIPVCILLCVLLAVLIGAAILSGSNLAVVFGALAVLVILFLIVIPVISIFQARFLTRVYGSAGE